LGKNNTKKSFDSLVGTDFHMILMKNLTIKH
jgi:hypothetical protein